MFPAGESQHYRITQQTRHCFISWAQVKGASAAAHYEYCKALSSFGHHVTLIARGEDPPYWDDENFFIVPIKSDHRIEKFAHLVFKASVIRFLARTQYDFVNVFLVPGASVYRLLLSKKKTKWVLHIRTSAVKQGLYGRIKNLLLRAESSCFDDITIIDLGIARNLFFSKASAKRLIELPLGVNNHRFVRLEDRRLQLFGERVTGNKILIYIGRLDPSRRIDIMIRAYAKVSQEHPHSVLIILGGDEQAVWLKSLTQELGIADNVIFLGLIPYELVPAYVASADIGLTYIPINKTYDCQPALKALEYRQMCIPQVATATSANQKLVSHGVNGLLSADDEDSYAAAILTLMRDIELYEKIRKGCRNEIEPHYWYSIVQRILLPFYISRLPRPNGEK